MENILLPSTLKLADWTLVCPSVMGETRSVLPHLETQICCKYGPGLSLSKIQRVCVAYLVPISNVKEVWILPKVPPPLHTHRMTDA